MRTHRGQAGTPLRGRHIASPCIPRADGPRGSAELPQRRGACCETPKEQTQSFALAFSGTPWRRGAGRSLGRRRDGASLVSWEHFASERWLLSGSGASKTSPEIHPSLVFIVGSAPGVPLSALLPPPPHPHPSSVPHADVCARRLCSCTCTFFALSLLFVPFLLTPPPEPVSSSCGRDHAGGDFSRALRPR